MTLKAVFIKILKFFTLVAIIIGWILCAILLFLGFWLPKRFNVFDLFEWYAIQILWVSHWAVNDRPWKEVKSVIKTNV